MRLLYHHWEGRLSNKINYIPLTCFPLDVWAGSSWDSSPNDVFIRSRLLFSITLCEHSDWGENKPSYYWFCSLYLHEKQIKKQVSAISTFSLPTIEFVQLNGRRIIKISKSQRFSCLTCVDTSNLNWESQNIFFHLCFWFCV